MAYRFENLGDEKFQEFCSALINLEFPNMQAFPVGQPDGGRDAISFDAEKKEFAVFQVKFVKNPDSIDDLSKWFLDIIRKEVSKVNSLIPKGAISYHLITNVRGTAHLATGSIDKMDLLLKEHVGITSWCWWHEDISRKLDAKPLLKWSYPQILDGQDILNSFVFQYFQKIERDEKEF